MRVALMATCVNDALFPDTLKSTATVLERLGVDVEFPPAQTCCAQPLVNSGHLDEAAGVVRAFVRAFEGVDAIVAPSASCVGAIRHQHALVARRAGDPGLLGQVEELAPRAYELSEYLIDVLGVEDVGASFPYRVAYHPTCHSLRALGLGDRPYRLLRAVRGLELVDFEGTDECCGFGGTFSVKNADVSAAMGADKVSRVSASGAEVLVSCDNSCLLHLGGLMSRGGGKVRALHLADVLASTEAPA